MLDNFTKQTQPLDLHIHKDSKYLSANSNVSGYIAIKHDPYVLYYIITSNMQQFQGINSFIQTTFTYQKIFLSLIK